jgi:site-specific DNA-cytosine methylase
MKVLELFSGTGSVGKVCKQLDWDVVSVDLILPADHQIDIMDFDYKQYPKDTFDMVWASPPCTSYSRLQDSWIGRTRNNKIFTKQDIQDMMNESDKLVIKTLEIINYFSPSVWFMENPQTGKLKTRDMMKDLPYYDVDYCMYSDWGYRKRTRIWTNKKDWNNKICDGKGTCGNMIQTLHKINLGNADRLKRAHKLASDGGNKKCKGTTQYERYRIPEDLILSLFLE